MQNIQKSYNKKVILNDVSLEMSNNEFVAILGPSGSGKTTLLRIIAGLESPNKGKIFFDNVDITSFQPKDRNVGMIFQNFHPIYPHLTVYDNLYLPLKIQKRPIREINKSINLMVEQLEIGHLLKRKSQNLSGGEMQRVAIAKNLLRNAKNNFNG